MRRIKSQNIVMKLMRPRPATTLITVFFKENLPIKESLYLFYGVDLAPSIKLSALVVLCFFSFLIRDGFKKKSREFSLIGGGVTMFNENIINLTSCK